MNTPIDNPSDCRLVEENSRKPSSHSDNIAKPEPAGESEDAKKNTIGGGKAAIQRTFPSGWRFRPTDEELVGYLVDKINGIPIDLEEGMSEVKLYSYSPDHLTDAYPHMGEHKWYFFTRQECSENVFNRVAGDGYWKPMGGDLNITVNEEEGSIIVHKKSFIYYRGTPPVNGIETNWIMHEYKSQNHMRSDDFVLCEIYDKRNAKMVTDDEDYSSGWDDMPSHGEFSDSGEEEE